MRAGFDVKEEKAGPSSSEIASGNPSFVDLQNALGMTPLIRGNIVCWHITKSGGKMKRYVVICITDI